MALSQGLRQAGSKSGLWYSILSTGTEPQQRALLDPPFVFTPREQQRCTAAEGGLVTDDEDGVVCAGVGPAGGGEQVGD